MLLGYLSNQRYEPVPGAQVEIRRADGKPVLQTTTAASGAIYGQLLPGRYEVILAAPGYCARRSRIRVPQEVPKAFRILSTELTGYVWPKWVQAGQLGEFRVHSTRAYQLGLWRYGLQKELVRPLGWFDEHAPGSEVQLVPDGDWTQQGLRWNRVGYDSPVHPQRVTAPERPGLYYFHARDEAGAEFSFPWIVAPRTPQAPVAVLLANLTWNAYNNFGGRSNYVHPEGLPPVPPVHARSEIAYYTSRPRTRYTVEQYPALSLDRPEPMNHVPLAAQAWEPIPGRNACHLAPAEWRLLAWLDRQGVAYDTWAETQLHAGLLPLERYRVLILGPHPEYWTETMYRRVKHWVHHEGGRLIYLGGNGINCAVTLSEDLSAMTVLNGDERRQQAQGVPSRFADRVEPEAALLGVMYDTRGVMTAAPYRVVDAGHWVFQDTGLGDQEPFGHHTLHQRVPGGASGHETDKRCEASPPGTRLLAKGTNPQDGGAEMTVYETASGGAVFAAGSITYPAALLVDRHISQVTWNVLRRFLQ